MKQRIRLCITKSICSKFRKAEAQFGDQKSNGYKRLQHLNFKDDNITPDLNSPTACSANFGKADQSVGGQNQILLTIRTLKTSKECQHVVFERVLIA